MEKDSTLHPRLLSSICSGDLSRVKTCIHVFLNKISGLKSLLQQMILDVEREDIFTDSQLSLFNKLKHLSLFIRISQRESHDYDNR